MQCNLIKCNIMMQCNVMQCNGIDCNGTELLWYHQGVRNPEPWGTELKKCGVF